MFHCLQVQLQVCVRYSPLKLFVNLGHYALPLEKHGFYFLNVNISHRGSVVLTVIGILNDTVFSCLSTTLSPLDMTCMEASVFVIFVLQYLFIFLSIRCHQHLFFMHLFINLLHLNRVRSGCIQV